MSDGFRKKFSRAKFTKSEDRLIDQIKDFKVRVNEAEKAVELDLEFYNLVDYILIFSLEDSIKKAYKINTVRVFPTFPTEYFTHECVGRFVATLKRVSPSGVSNGFFEGAVSEYNNNDKVLIIRLRPGVSSTLLVNSGVHLFFEECILYQFNLPVKVVILNSENVLVEDRTEIVELEYKASEHYAALLEQEQNAEKQSSIEESPSELKNIDCSDSENLVTSGNIIFDIFDPKVIYGKSKSCDMVSISDIKEGETVRFPGRAFQIDSRIDYKSGRESYKIYVTDLHSSITVRLSGDKDKPLDLPNPPMSIIVEGKAQHNRFDDEVVVRATYIASIKEVHLTDDAEETRVELHLHTKMSAMDAIIEPADAIKAAYERNMPAIAITDHGSLQAFPEVMKACKKYPGVKPLYGIEGYLVDDTARAVFEYSPKNNRKFKTGTFIIFDIETTGLSPQTCGITQIAAIKYRAGRIIDKLETYVNPEMPIPANISRLTGITDDMVANAPSKKDAVKKFLEFSGKNILVAHNALFDIGFIRKVCDDHKIRFNNPYLDTLSLSRFINNDISKHTLDTLAKYYKLGTFDHHQAGEDTEMLAKIFEVMSEKLEQNGITDIEEMSDSMARHTDPKRLFHYHVTILVQNKVGLKNLYKLVSESYLNYFYRVPRIPKTLLNNYREGLLVGSACSEGELFQALLENKTPEDIKTIAEFYDYLEIMPLTNNFYLIDEERLGTEREAAIQQLKDFNFKIVELGERLKKPVCATGDVHFINSHDEIYRKILLNGKKFRNYDKNTGLYLRTTEQMLEAFSYLDSEKAKEVVIHNPRAIAESIEYLLPIPKETFTPKIEGAEEELLEICKTTVNELYGSTPSAEVTVRMEQELTSITKNGFAVLYIIARRLVKNSEEKGYLVGSRGSVGSSFIATLAGISEVNPLPPHYRCPVCKHTIFINDKSVGSGFDLPDKDCPLCSQKMIQDGQDIPFETFLGFHGEKAPDIDLNFSGGTIQMEAHKFTEELFGSENIFRAGTVGTLRDKTCYAFVKDYLSVKNLHITKAEQNRLINGLLGVKRTTGQHPGGILVIPKEEEIYNFTPVQYPADNVESGVITTHFAFEYLHDTLLKLDILGHDVPTLYHMLSTATGIDVRTIPMNDVDVMELFLSTKSIGVTPEQIFSETGTLGLPEFGTKYVRQILADTKPKNFSDLVQISGLSHGTGIWLGNGDELIREGICTVDEIIGTRDSIMLFLMKEGLKSKDAFAIMESVRRGRGVTSEQEHEMLEHGIPLWYISSCKKIKYMFPKAHAAAYVIAALRLGWYKIHYPLEFYASYFSVKTDAFEADIALKGYGGLKRYLQDLEQESDNLTKKEKDILSSMQIVLEMLARGYEFLPVDIYKSKANEFVPESGKIRLPLSTLKGLGATAAENIYKAIHEEKVTTLEELRVKASLNKTVVEVLQSNDCLSTLPETNQITMF